MKWIQVPAKICLFLLLLSHCGGYAHSQLTTDDAQTPNVEQFDYDVLPEGVEKPEHLTDLRDTLRAFSAREATPLFFQIYLSEHLLNLESSIPLGVRAMDSLKRATYVPRAWEQIQGVQMFYGDLGSVRFAEKENAQILSWLSALSGDEVNRLVRDSLPFNRVPLTVEEALVHSVAWENSDLATVLWDRRSDFSLRLRFHPYISAIDEDDPNFTQLNPIDLPLLKPLVEPLPPVVELPFLPLEPMKIQPGEKVIDFGAGDILSWPEIIERANPAFGVTYQAPKAKDSTRFFVSGVISQSAWEATLKFLQEAKPLPPAPDEAEVERTPESRAFAKRALQAFPFLEKMSVDTAYLRGENSFMVAQRRARQNNGEEQDPRDIEYQWDRLAGNEEFLPLIDFVNQKETTVAELIKKSPGASDISLGITGANGIVTPLEPIRPGLAAELEKAGFKPSDKVRLRLSLSLEVSAPGKHPSSLSGLVVNGKLVPLMDDNRALISIN